MATSPGSININVGPVVDKKIEALKPWITTEIEARIKDVSRAFIVQVCDERISAFATDLYNSMRQGNQIVANRIGNIHSSVDGGCDSDLSKDVSNVSIPKHVADVLDAVRQGKPGVYRALVDAANVIWTGDPLQRSVNTSAMLDALIRKLEAATSAASASASTLPRPS